MSGKEVRDALGSNIKLFRFHRELSQADLAGEAGISITFLSDIERGNKWPYPDTLSNLAQALKVPVYELFKRQDDIPDEAKSVIRQFSEDVSRVINQSLESVYKKYNVL
ncbi:MAG: helix-turn-helix domain-containing protein [Treponema sp.]|jgi:transcriptional regulator with XRE-family HTH domain|nr:helix-turn-helix domain-containing protein [Treponema sp.]